MGGFELPNRPSVDFPQEAIGDPVMDIVLKVVLSGECIIYTDDTASHWI
jgi:hypothetical protein